METDLETTALKADEAAYAINWIIMNADTKTESEYWHGVRDRLRSIAAAARQPALTEYVVVQWKSEQLNPYIISGKAFDNMVKEIQSLYTVHHRFKA